jgi:hypothetical protein
MAIESEPEVPATQDLPSSEGIRHVANDPPTGTMEAELMRALQQVKPDEIRIATAYMTPDGFMELGEHFHKAARVKVLLGERPFLMPRGPRDVLGSADDADLAGPAEVIDWYQFLEGDYPWLLMSHDHRKEALGAVGRERLAPHRDPARPARA